MLRKLANYFYGTEVETSAKCRGRGGRERHTRWLRGRDLDPNFHQDFYLKGLKGFLRNYDNKPLAGNFNPLEKFLKERLTGLLRDLSLPLSGPWSAQVLGKVHCPGRQKSNVAVLKNFCREANRMAEQISRTLTDDARRKEILGIIEEFFVDFVNDENNFAAAEDGEQDFAVLAGYARSPVYMNYIAEDEMEVPEGIEVFAPVEARLVDTEVLAVLNKIFASLESRIDLRPWHYTLFDDFGSDDSNEGFVYNSAMPFINKNALQETQERYGGYHNANELIAHEMVHALFRQLGYEETINPKEASFVPGMSRAQVHELVAFSAGIQFAPLPVLFNLLTQYDPEYVLAIPPYTRQLSEVK